MLEALFGEKAKTIGNLFASSFRLLGENQIKTILIERARFSIATHALFLAALGFIFYGAHPGFGWLLFFVLILCIYPYSFFYHVNKRASQTWIAYAKITNRPTSPTETQEVVSSQKWSLRSFAIAELVIASANRSENNQQGPLGMLVAAALAALDGLFDVAESYLLPAVIIERLPLTQTAPKLKQLRQNVPTALAGAFGLDIFAGVVSSVLFLLYAAIMIAAGILAWGAGHIASFPPSLLTTVTSNHQPVHLFVFPVLAGITLVSLLHRLIKIFVTSMKATYFAVFYTAINRPSEIRADMKDQVAAYLTAPATPGGAN